MEGKAIKLYVSHFGKYKQLKAAGVAVVSIARFNPKWAKDLEGWCTSLAPTGDMIKLPVGEEYDRRFKEILAKRNPHTMYAEISKRNPRHEMVALCCYEKDWNECHRKLVAEWFTKAGYECSEFGMTVRKGPKVTQTELF